MPFQYLSLISVLKIIFLIYKSFEMKLFFSPKLFLLFFLFFSCKTPQAVIHNTDDGKIEIVFLQVNDVYEIAPLGGGSIGGMARLATLKKRLLKKNKNTFTVHAGDFMNPSLIGTIKYEGEIIKGRQMVETMNAIGFDLVAFGNHEFDLDEEDLQKRLNESDFEYIATNLQQRCGDKLYPFYSEKNGKKHFYPETVTWEISDADGTKIKLGIFSATIDSNPRDYVLYENFEEKATAANEALKKSTDLVIGLTHLSIEEDLRLANKFQNVPLIMGGHEHDNTRQVVKNCVVAKADANAKTAYVHTLIFDTKTKTTTLKSDLVPIDESIAFEPEVDKVVQKWNQILEEKITEIVPNPYEVIYSATTPFDGRESSIRNKQTNLGELITKSMLFAKKNGAAAALVNGGSVRIDDQISGEITPFDIFRALPFGGDILEVELTGKLLIDVLNYSETKKGSGAYLQRGNINFVNNQWQIDSKNIDPNTNYTIALSDYLIKGLDIPVLKEGAEGVLNVYRFNEGDKTDFRSDIRLAIIEYLKQL